MECLCTLCSVVEDTGDVSLKLTTAKNFDKRLQKIDKNVKSILVDKRGIKKLQPTRHQSPVHLLSATPLHLSNH